MTRTLYDVKKDVKRFYTVLFKALNRQAEKEYAFQMSMYILYLAHKSFIILFLLCILIYALFSGTKAWSFPLSVCFFCCGMGCFAVKIVMHMRAKKQKWTKLSETPIPLGMLTEEKDIENAVRDAELVDVDIIPVCHHETKEEKAMSYILYFFKDKNVVCLDTLISHIDVCPSTDGTLHIARKGDRVTTVAIPEEVLSRATPLFPVGEF